jgi:hypothetical protein
MSTLRTNAILDASGGTTATVNGIPLRPGVLDPENRIINGAFDFWQRGTSSTAAGFLADRFNNGLSGGTVTTSRQAFSAGDTLGSNNPSFFFRQTVSGQSASSHYAQTTHPIEGVRSYAGQTITLLGWARRSSGSGNAAIDLTQYFGSGGSPSGNVSISPQTLTLTGSWAAFALTFVIPSISGKTIGTNNNDYLTLNLWTSAGSDYNARTNSLGVQTIGVDLWGIHIKQGTHTTAAVDLYRQPELGPELERCQRYYERFDIAGAASYYLGMGMMWATNAGRLVVPYKMQKRAIPSVFVSGTLRFGDGTGIGVVTSFAVDGPSVDTALVYGTFSSGSGTQGRAAQVYTDTTFSLGIDAEL